MNVLQGLWPGEVASYDGAARTCRVRIVGITEGSTELPEAVFNNALGDRAGDTEIRILVGDPVWLMFEAGDPRFPIIMGYRTPRAGNPVDWRRWRHANIEMTADGEMRLLSGVATVIQAGDTVAVSAGSSITLTAPAITLNGAVTVTKNIAVQGAGGGASSMVGNFSLVGALALQGDIALTGSLAASGTVTDSDGNNGA
jgi:phage baseplate assembly protein gpV